METKRIDPRVLDLYTYVNDAVKEFGVLTAKSAENDITVTYNYRTLCRISLAGEGFQISEVDYAWNRETTYLTIPTKEGASYLYYVDTIDECIGEACRLVQRELQQWQLYAQGELIDWNTDTEKLLADLCTYFSKLLLGSKYHIAKNPTINEPALNIYEDGIERRIGYIWPSKSSITLDITLPIELVNELRNLDPSLEITEVRPGRYPNSRVLKKVLMETATEMLLYLARMNTFPDAELYSYIAKHR